jgi:beta-glucosidase
MQLTIKFLLMLFILGIISSCHTKDKEYFMSSKDEYIYARIDSIISLMTLKEKAGQMLNLGLPALLTGEFYNTRDTLIFDETKVDRLLIQYGAGSVQNKGNFPLSVEEWRHYIGQIQNTVQQKSRLKIPVLYGIDAVHGANYTKGSVMFPHQINLAATFDTARAFEVGEITAYELKASGIPWNYAPVLDVARNPLWGRIYETFGEDRYVVSQLGNAMIKGMQGTDPSAYNKVVACGKHLIGYGAPYNGKDRSPAYIPERLVRQILLPPFEQAIDNGLITIMLASGTLNGTPSHIDKWLITDVLKEEMGFQGAVISDWDDIMSLVTVHRVALNEREAVKLAVNAGLDICMEPYDESFSVHLIDLVESGEVGESRVDDAVKRILYVKYISGVFKDPMFSSYKYEEFAHEQSHLLNLEIARESITLLKNEDNILPLSKNTKVLVTGVSANSLNYLNGGWSRTWAGENPAYNDQDKLTILEAIKQEIGESNVEYAQGTSYLEEIDIHDAVRNSKKSDVIIACVGEKPSTEKPSDIEFLDLPYAQIKLVKELAKTGKPLILVMVQGRPRIISEIEPFATSVIMAYLPGNEGGIAISDVLFGNFNPCGKLPYTYPRFSGSIWTYDHLTSDKRDVNFGLNGFTPQYEFGHGLSYSTFDYGLIQINQDTISAEDSLTVWLEITNSGKRSGKESVLLYLTDEVASISPPVKQLVRFTKINLNPNQKKTVKFTLSARDLMFVNTKQKWNAEKGFFTLSAGNQSTRFYLNNNITLK